MTCPQSWHGRCVVAACVLLLGAVAACATKVVAPPEPPPSVRRGDTAFRYEEYETAIDDYQIYLDAVDHGEYTAHVFYKSALASYRLGHYRETLVTLDDLSRRYPDGHWVQVDALRGDAYSAMERPTMALRAWDHAWEAADEQDREKLADRILQVAGGLSNAQLAEARRLLNSKEVIALVDRQVELRQPPTLSEAIPAIEHEPAFEVTEIGTAPSPGTTETAAALADTGPQTKPGRAERMVDTAAAPRQEVRTDREPVQQPPRTLGAVTATETAGVQQIPASAEARSRASIREEVLAAPPPGSAHPAAVETTRAADLQPMPVIGPEQPLVAAAAVRIGCLLPLSGPHRDPGERSLRAVRLALGEHGDRLIVKDTGGDPAAAARVLDELAQDPGVVVTIGPLRDETARAVAPAAERAGLPLLLLSQEDGLTGHYVLQAGMRHTHLIGTLLDYAMERVRLRRFGVMYPEGASGRQMVSAFESEVKLRGGTVVGVGAYRAETPGLGAVAMKRWHDDKNLEAVFVPDGAAAAVRFAKFLQREMPDVTLLGVEGWESLADQDGAGGVNGVLFSEGFYVNSTRAATREFVARYRTRYGVSPDLFGAQAYDAAILAARTLAADATSRAAALDALRMLGPVQGATGELEVTPHGLQRRPFLFQVYDGRLREIASSSTS